MPMFGTSFSAFYCRELGVDPLDCLQAALLDLGVRRLRLMSYWNVHEQTRGRYDFTELDVQMQLAQDYGASVTLAIGLRQPRWPESHWPGWAKDLPKAEWQTALMDYIEAVVLRYKDHPSLVSWQLENEAMLKNFGKDGNFDRGRLRQEYKLVKRLDTDHPIIMTTSDSWGIPILGPRPDMFGFSVYRYFYDKGEYRHATRPAIFYAVRANLIRIFTLRRTFIHELQAEPWGPKGTAELSLDEQFKSMNLERVIEAIELAKRTQLSPVDIWGLEWWYYLKTQHNDSRIWDYIRKNITA